MLMCRKHWGMVPERVQQAVWRTYRPGQEVDKSPSEAYMLAQRAAVWTVFVREGGCEWEDVPYVGTRDYLMGPIILSSGGYHGT